MIRCEPEMRKSPWWAVVCMLALISVPSLRAQSAQRGRLEGMVWDAKGAPLPGVTVTATSSSLQGERRTATEAGGSYVLRDLPSGQYVVLFEFPGLQSVEQPVLVEIGRTSRAEAAMDLAQFDEAVVVEASSPPVLDSSEGGANFTRKEVDSLPINRAPQHIAKLAAGVSESPVYDEQIKISGGYTYDNTFLIEGHDVSDWFGAPVAGVDVVTGPFIEDAIEETQVLTSAISAEQGRFSGGVVNMVTKSGGNELSGSIRVDLSDTAWRDETPLENRLGVTREGHRAAVYSATLGGPILRDELWFFVAGRRNDQSKTSTMAVSGAPRPSDYLDERYEVKLTGTLNDSHSLQATWIDAELDGETAFPWIIDPRAITPQRIPNDLKVLRYAGVLTPRLFVEVQASARDFAFYEGGSDRDRNDLRNSPIYSFTEFWLYNHPELDPQDPDGLDTERLAASASWFASGASVGSHDVKLGVERFEETKFWGGTFSPTGLEFVADYLADEAGQPIYDTQGRFQPLFPDSSSCCTLAYKDLSVPGARLITETTALYLNDRWVLDDRWSFNLGLRYEMASGHGTPGVETVDDSVVAPRLALSVDPKGDGRFRLGASYGEYPGKYHNRQFGRFTDYAGRGFIVYLYTGPPGTGLDFAPGFDLGNYVPIVYQGRESNLLAAGTHSAVSEERTLSAGIQLPRGGWIEAILVDRRLTGILEEFVTIDNGSTLVEIDGEEFRADNRLLRNTDLSRRRYRAIHTQGYYRLTDSWTVNGSWTWQLENHGNSDPDTGGSWRTEPLGDYPEILPQERVAPSGRLVDYQAHRIRLWTNYGWSLGRSRIDASLLYRYDSPRTFSLVAGAEVTATQLANDPGYATPPAVQELYFGRRGSEEFDDSHVFDLAARYSFVPWRSVEPWIKLEVRNLFDDSSMRSWNTTVLADFDGPLDEYGLPIDYIEGPHFGEANAPEDYVIPREFLVSAGIRF